MNKSAKFWNRRAAKFDTEEDKNSEIRQAKYDKIKKYLNKEQFVLDYGCAVGSLCQVMSPYVKEMHGVDSSSEMIRLAAEKAKEKNLYNLKFIEGDILEDKFQNSRYDVVIAMYVVHLVQDPEKTLERLVDIVSPEGFFIMEVPCIKKLNFFKKIFLIPFIKLMGLPYLSYFNKEDIDKMLAKHQVTVVEQEYSTKKFPRYFIVAKKA